MRVTIKDIARVAGVSIAAVSKALNDQPDISEKTKDRIRKISRDLGYSPNMIARNLVKKGNRTIGVLVPDISTPIYPAIYKGINATALKLGYTLLLGDTNRSLESEKHYARVMVENRVAGLAVSPVGNDTNHLEEIVDGQFPIVYFGGKVHDTMKHFVSINNFRGASLATAHLIEKGHRNIAMIIDKNETKTRIDRIRGYKRVMEQSNLEPQLIIGKGGLLGRECGAIEMELLLDGGSKLPTAIFAINDSMAIGVMEVLIKRGFRIPEDIAVIGYDDIPFASLPMINLSTIWQPKYETGVAAVELMDRILNSPEDSIPINMMLEPELKVRRSTSNG